MNAWLPQASYPCGKVEMYKSLYNLITRFIRLKSLSSIFISFLRISALTEIRHSPNFGACRNPAFSEFWCLPKFGIPEFWRLPKSGTSIIFPNNASRSIFKPLTKHHPKQTDTKLALKSLRILDQVLSNYSAAQLDPLSSQRTLRPCFQARETPKGRTGFYTRNS